MCSAYSICAVPWFPSSTCACASRCAPPTLRSAEFSPLTVIIVLSLRTADGVRECGIVVDSVSDVVDIDAQAIKPPPQFGNASAQDFIGGIATVEDSMLILLNVDDLVGKDLTPTGLVAAA